MERAKTRRFNNMINPDDFSVQELTPQEMIQTSGGIRAPGGYTTYPPLSPRDWNMIGQTLDNLAGGIPLFIHDD